MMKGFHHPNGSQQAFLRGLAHLYNLVPYQRPNMARTSCTSVGSSADSPAPPLRPSPATGHAAEILDGEDPYLRYDAEKFPYKPPQ
jgi:hypothetical protein